MKSFTNKFVVFRIYFFLVFIYVYVSSLMLCVCECVCWRGFGFHLHRVIPKKAEPRSFFITSTKIKQNNSNFVNSNFWTCW